jgi:RNA polymerase sigma-70 factor (ECF subfamily)
MTDTPRSLLERLREEPDEESWKCLVDLYTPLLSRWLEQAGVAGTDADDLMQEVFVALARELPTFEHNQQRGAFSRWLRTILINRLRIYWNAKRTPTSAGCSVEDGQALDRLEDPSSDLNRLWEHEHDALLAQRILQLIEKDFTASTWHVFRRVVLEGAKPAEVSAETGLSINAVLLAKSRVLRRARREIAGLIDD